MKSGYLIPPLTFHRYIFLMDIHTGLFLFRLPKFQNSGHQHGKKDCWTLMGKSSWNLLPLFP